MSWLRFSVMLSTIALLVGLSSTAALSQDAPRPRDPRVVRDRGPSPANPAGIPLVADPSTAQPPSEGENGTPGQQLLIDQPQPQGVSPVNIDGSIVPPSPSRPRGALPPGQVGFRIRPIMPGSAARYRYGFDVATPDPELNEAIQADRELERQSRELGNQFRSAGNSEQRARVKAKLVEIVDKHFEVRQQLRNLEVKRLEQQVKQLHDKIELRAKSRKDLVDKRIIELTGVDEGERF